MHTGPESSHDPARASYAPAGQYLPPYLLPSSVSTGGQVLPVQPKRRRGRKLVGIGTLVAVAFAAGAAIRGGSSDQETGAPALAAAAAPAKTAATVKHHPKVSATATHAPTARTTKRPAWHPPTHRTTTPAAPVAAPRYVASPGEIASAEADLAQAEEMYRQSIADPYASSSDRSLAALRCEKADAFLKALKAGHPERVDRDLQIAEAQQNLEQAEADYRLAMADPAGSSADRQSAAADVRLWRERVRKLKSGK